MERKEIPWNREMMVLRIRARYQMSSTPYAKWYQNNHADYLAKTLNENAKITLKITVFSYGYDKDWHTCKEIRMVLFTNSNIRQSSFVKKCLYRQAGTLFSTFSSVEPALEPRKLAVSDRPAALKPVDTHTPGSVMKSGQMSSGSRGPGHTDAPRGGGIGIFNIRVNPASLSFLTTQPQRHRIPGV